MHTIHSRAFATHPAHGSRVDGNITTHEQLGYTKISRVRAVSARSVRLVAPLGTSRNSSDESSDDESSDDESSDLGSGEQKGASGMYECPLCDDTVEGINRCDSCDTLYCARHLPWNISRCSLCLEADDDDNVGNDGSDSDSAEKGERGGRNSAEKGDGDGDSVAGGAAAASEEVVVSEVEDDECCEICNM